jgi:deazaflavin-dependent oxidoreductase (nitroreductase family)
MTPPVKGTPASRSRVFVVLNPFMRFMLRRPIRRMQEQLLLLSFTGRRSGKRYTIPLSYTEEDDGSLLVPGGGAWKRNLQPGRPVAVRLRGADRVADPELILDPDEIERLLPRMYAGNSRVESFVGVPIGPNGKPDRPRLEQAIGEGFAIVRLVLTSATGPPPQR